MAYCIVVCKQFKTYPLLHQYLKKSKVDYILFWAMVRVNQIMEHCLYYGNLH